MTDKAALLMFKEMDACDNCVHCARERRCNAEAERFERQGKEWHCPTIEVCFKGNMRYFEQMAKEEENENESLHN